MTDDPFEGPSWVDRFLLPFVRESTLWPVLIVLIGHAVAIIVPLLLMAIRDARISSMCVLAALALASLAAVRFELRRQARPGALSGIVLATWLVSGALAVAADHYELL